MWCRKEICVRNYNSQINSCQRDRKHKLRLRMWNRWKNLIFLSYSSGISKENLFFPSPSKRCHSKFLVSIRNEAGWNECVGERRMFCAQNEISIQHQKRNMLAKQYGCLLTFVYLFKWNRQMETILGGRNMRDNNFDEQSSFYFFLACVKISHNILLPVIECSFFEITKLNCICSISEM